MRSTGAAGSQKGLFASEIGTIVNLDEHSVCRWLKRYIAEGMEVLKDAPHLGVPEVVTPGYRVRLVSAERQRPHSLDLPFSLWTLICPHLLDPPRVRADSVVQMP